MHRCSGRCRGRGEAERAPAARCAAPSHAHFAFVFLGLRDVIHSLLHSLVQLLELFGLGKAYRMPPLLPGEDKKVTSRLRDGVITSVRVEASKRPSAQDNGQRAIADSVKRLSDGAFTLSNFMFL